MRQLKTHGERKERELRNIFSDPIIEAELGRFAESELKKERARVFREHIKKTGGRFPRFSFGREVCSPDLVAPVLSDDPIPRPSFAPVNSSSNILGLQPQASHVDDDEGLEIIEHTSLVRVTARPDDIADMSLHCSNFNRAPSSRPTSAYPAKYNPQSTASRPQSAASRPLSAVSRVSALDGEGVARSLLLSGDSLSGRLVAASGQGDSIRSTYVTAGNIPSSFHSSSHLLLFCFAQSSTAFFKLPPRFRFGREKK